MQFKHVINKDQPAIFKQDIELLYRRTESSTYIFNKNTGKIAFLILAVAYDICSKITNVEPSLFMLHLYVETKKMEEKK